MNRHDEAHSTCLNILTDSPHSAPRIAELCTFARRLGGEIDDLRAQLAACAAGPWRTDVENAPFDQYMLYRRDNRQRYAMRTSTGWIDGNYYIDPPDAFAIPNPPQVTT